MITTREGCAGLFMHSGRSFLVANTAAEFKKHISALLNDPDLCYEISSNAIKLASEIFSSQNCYTELECVLKKVKSEYPIAVKTNTVPNTTSIIFIGDKDFPLYKGSQEALRLYKNSNYISFKSVNHENILDYIDKHLAERVFINNPYANSKILSIYRILKINEIPVTTFDRGALPNSWFFDDNGFNADSTSYCESHWEKYLNSDLSSTKEYISEIFRSGHTLEKQGKRLNNVELRKKYSLHDQKIAFIPFQRPNDTVVKYFTNDECGMQGFLDFIQKISSYLKSKGYVIVGKKHPLERDFPNIDCVMLDHNTHVYDILNISDVVLTINSGVGLFGLMLGLPVFCFGRSIYTFKGMGVHTPNFDEFTKRFELANVINSEKILSYIKYLREDFYSFGETEYEFRREKNGSVSPIVQKISFDKIRGINN